MTWPRIWNPNSPSGRQFHDLSLYLGTNLGFSPKNVKLTLQKVDKVDFGVRSWI